MIKNVNRSSYKVPAILVRY